MSDSSVGKPTNRYAEDFVFNPTTPMNHLCSLCKDDIVYCFFRASEAIDNGYLEHVWQLLLGKLMPNLGIMSILLSISAVIFAQLIFYSSTCSSKARLWTNR